MPGEVKMAERMGGDGVPSRVNEMPRIYSAADEHEDVEVWIESIDKRLIGRVGDRLYRYNWPGWLALYVGAGSAKPGRAPTPRDHAMKLDALAERIPVDVRVISMTRWATSMSSSPETVHYGGGCAEYTGRMMINACGEGYRAEYEVIGNSVRTNRLGPIRFSVELEVAGHGGMVPATIREIAIGRVMEALVDTPDGHMGEGVWATKVSFG